MLICVALLETNMDVHYFELKVINDLFIHAWEASNGVMFLSAKGIK